MPTITKVQAVQRLADEIKGLPDDDLIDVFNELFPDRPAKDNPSSLEIKAIAKQVADHVQRGLEIEEILSLWHILFPKNRNRDYDYEADTLTFDEKSEAYESVD